MTSSFDTFLNNDSHLHSIFILYLQLSLSPVHLVDVLNQPYSVMPFQLHIRLVIDFLLFYELQLSNNVWNHLNSQVVLKCFFHKKVVDDQQNRLSQTTTQYGVIVIQFSQASELLNALVFGADVCFV
jgi:hypothetical protein